MFVNPDQLVEKCLITRDIYGKTQFPIVEQNTVVTATHIKVLKSFLVEQIEVSPKLVNGQPFIPNQLHSSFKKQTEPTIENKTETDFLIDYQKTVNQYEKMFKQWQSGQLINIQAIRNLIIPLIKRIDHHHAEIFSLGLHAIKEKYLYHHSVATSLLATLLAKQLGLEQESTQIGLAALLADSGMAKINHRIVNHKGKLHEMDYEEIKKHPTFSYRFIENSLALTQNAKLGILQHHERIDGQGYPLGISNRKINQHAKIISIVDAYHAMTSERYFQMEQPFFQVILAMKKQANLQFDLQLLNRFITCLEEALLEEKVYLSNGQTGTIVSLRFTEEPELIIKIDGANDILSIGDQDQIWIEHLIER